MHLVHSCQPLYASGAEAVIIYNNLSGSFVGAIEGGVKIPAVSVSKEDGIKHYVDHVVE